MEFKKRVYFCMKSLIVNLKRVEITLNGTNLKVFVVSVQLYHHYIYITRINLSPQQTTVSKLHLKTKI